MKKRCNEYPMKEPKHWKDIGYNVGALSITPTVDMLSEEGQVKVIVVEAEKARLPVVYDSSYALDWWYKKVKSMGFVNKDGANMEGLKVFLDELMEYVVSKSDTEFDEDIQHAIEILSKRMPGVSREQIVKMVKGMQ